MQLYTTGEVAKACHVSVRTIQYYDTRDILKPSAISEGGRRLYTEADLKKCQIVCFLRKLELPIDSIKQLLAEEHSEEVLATLLAEQEKLLRGEIAEKEKRAAMLADVRRSLARHPVPTVEAIGDAKEMIENKRARTRFHGKMLGIGFLMDAIEIFTLCLWIFRGIWWPFAAGIAVSILLGVYVSVSYYRHVDFLCPICHKYFRPRLRESFFARHTPNTRKLTCTRCGYHGFCVETYTTGETTDVTD